MRICFFLVLSLLLPAYGMASVVSVAATKPPQKKATPAKKSQAKTQPGRKAAAVTAPVVVTAPGPDQAGYVHYWLITASDGE